jgi:hypothetical protein
MYMTVTRSSSPVREFLCVVGMDLRTAEMSCQGAAGH